MKRVIALTLLCTLIPFLVGGELLYAAQAKRVQKYSLAVLPLSAEGALGARESNRLHQLLENELATYPIFEVEQGPAVLSTLQSHGLDPQDCASADCARAAGRLLEVQLVSFGRVQRVGSGFVVVITILHVKSGQIVKSIRDDIAGNTEALFAAIPKLVDELMGIANGSSDTTSPATTVHEVSSTKVPEVLTSESEATGQQDASSATTDVGEMAPKKSGKSRSKLVILGLLAAGAVGAGLYFAQKGNETGGAGEVVPVSDLPTPPAFPKSR